MKATILPEAEWELETAFDYYERQRVGLGLEFVTEYRRALDLIIDFPFAWQEIRDGFRKCRVSRFPYAILYRYFPQENLLLVETLIHLARNDY